MTRRGCRPQGGATFVELMLAVLVVGVALVAASASQLGTLQVQAEMVPEGTTVRALAEEIHQMALRLPWGGAEPSSVGDVAMLGDLDGRVFTPPRSGAGTVLSGFDGWSQAVEVRSVDTADPSQPAQPGQPPLTELTVTIHQGSVEQGRFSWWLARPSGD